MENRTRILFVLQHLIENSNSDHPCSGNSIVEAYFNCYGNTATLKTIYQDITDLTEAGFPIRRKRRGFYLDGLLFDNSQLYLLSEMVCDSKYLSELEQKWLINQLASLTNKYDRKLLENKLDNSTKGNEGSLKNVDLLLEAIKSKCLISFRYYDLGIKKEKLYRHHQYQLYPLDIVVNQSQCYLIGYQKKYNSINKYRLEKIDRIVLDQAKTIEVAYDRSEYLKHNFSMFQAQRVNVNLFCQKGYLDYLFNQFNDEIIIVKQLDEGYLCNISVALSQTFFAGVFTFGGKIKIISPDTVKHQFIQYCQKMIEIHR
ncbi:MAG: helix-turn-helix transcriptional regulator [Erysipelotrichaceae bacterium]